MSKSCWFLSSLDDSYYVWASMTSALGEEVSSGRLNISEAVDKESSRGIVLQKESISTLMKGDDLTSIRSTTWTNISYGSSLD